jgi:hypothetical protein
MIGFPGMGPRGRAGLTALALTPLFAAATGCMSHQLEWTTRRTVGTLPDLRYQQVVDNLAMIAANPGYLPYLAVAGQGSVQVTDGGSSNLGLNLAPNAWTTAAPAFGATRNVTGTWSLGTITSPEKLRAMQAAYRHVIERSVAGDPAYQWLHVGEKRMVGKRALFIGARDGKFVWVAADGIAGLSDLTLTIMDIATREDIDPDNARGNDRARAADGSPAIPRRNFQVPAAGPVFTPGVR